MQIRNVPNLMTFKGDRKGRPYKQFIPEASVGVGVGVGVGVYASNQASNPTPSLST